MRSADFCPHCTKPTDEPASRRPRARCPHCGASLAHDTQPRWINVARVANLAEAGFLVDELAGEEIEARIFQSDDFNALTDRWQASYLIQSPPEFAHAAAAQIRRQLAELETFAEPADSDDTYTGAAADALLWRPVAMVILASVTSFAVGQRWGINHDARPTRDSLAGVMAALDRPLVSEPGAAGPRHRLYYHSRERAWYLDTDADADGQFEGRQRFHAGGARW